MKSSFLESSPRALQVAPNRRIQIIGARPEKKRRRDEMTHEKLSSRSRGRDREKSRLPTLLMQHIQDTRSSPAARGYSYIGLRRVSKDTSLYWSRVPRVPRPTQFVLRTHEEKKIVSMMSAVAGAKHNNVMQQWQEQKRGSSASRRPRRDAPPADWAARAPHSLC